MRHLLSIIFGAVFTAAVCWSLGRFFFARLRIQLRKGEHELLAGMVGASLLSFVVFLLCATHLARIPVFFTVGAVALGLNWTTRGNGARDESAGLSLPWRWLAGVPFAFYAVLYLSNSLAPENSPDGSTYHLGLVYRYYRQHGFERLTTNMYGNLSQGAEMLFLYAFSFGRHPAAATLHCCFLFTLPLLIFFYARRIGKPAAGACAGMLVYLSPLAGIDGVSAYNDVALAAAAFAAFYLLEIWREERANALLVPIGLAAGFCFAIKYTGFVVSLYAVCIVLWELSFRARFRLKMPGRIAIRRTTRDGDSGLTLSWVKSSRLVTAATEGPTQSNRRTVFALGLLIAGIVLMAGPWLIKNWIWLGNPLSPFLNRAFPNPFTHVTFEDDYRLYFRSYDLPTLRPLFWMVTVGGQLGGQLGPVFLLSPLALLGLVTRDGRRLLLAALFLLLPYPQNLGARFLIPVLPFAALGVAMAFSFSHAAFPRYLNAALIVLAAVLAWPRIIDKYRAPAGGWQITTMPWQAALGIVPQDKWMTRRSGGWVIARMLDEFVPEGKRVWSSMPVAEAYSKTEVLVNYYSAEGELLQDILAAGSQHDRQPIWNLRYTFPVRTVERLRVVQDASVSDIWSVTEMKFFLGDREIPREKQWKLDATPFPWDIGLAFDGNPTTRWRAWEPSHPGMHLDVDFGRPVDLDRIEVHCTPDQWKVNVTVEGYDGKLEKLEDPPEDLRRTATASVKARGIDYLLVGSDHFLGEDMHSDPARWGMKLISDRGPNWLFQIQ